jgi:hypothetical protein
LGTRREAGTTGDAFHKTNHFYKVKLLLIKNDLHEEINTNNPHALVPSKSCQVPLVHKISNQNLLSKALKKRLQF